MRRDAGAVVLAAVAVLAIVAGAASLDGALSDGGPGANGTEADEDGGLDVLREVEGAGSGPPGGGSCPFCVSISLRGLVGGLAFAFSGPVLAVLALVGAALAALSWRRATGGAGVHEAAETVTTTDPAPADATPAASPVPASQPPATNPIYAAWQRAASAVVAATPGATADDDTAGGDADGDADGDGDGHPTAGADALTPREHVALGRERGLDGGALEDLAAVFERVRYGAAPATEDRVERARDALGRLGIDREDGSARDPPAPDDADGTADPDPTGAGAQE